MTSIDKEIAKLVQETGISKDRVVQLLMAEQAKSLGTPYTVAVEHEKYGLQLEFYPGKENSHKPFSLSPKKLHSVFSNLETAREYYARHYNGKDKPPVTKLRKQ